MRQDLTEVQYYSADYSNLDKKYENLWSNSILIENYHFCEEFWHRKEHWALLFLKINHLKKPLSPHQSLFCNILKWISCIMNIGFWKILSILFLLLFHQQQACNSNIWYQSKIFQSIGFGILISITLKNENK